MREHARELEHRRIDRLDPADDVGERRLTNSACDGRATVRERLGRRSALSVRYWWPSLSATVDFCLPVVIGKDHTRGSHIGGRSTRDHDEFVCLEGSLVTDHAVLRDPEAH